jgi:muramidase (phage lysozyme)
VSNLRAFLDTIAVSELGAALIALSDNGYNVIVGSTPKKPVLFESYADHPRHLMTMVIKGKIVKSTAAGRYQVLERYFDHYKKQLDLPDFDHEAQDRIATQLIRECLAIEDIEAGRFAEAAHKCRSRWASLPGAGYGQHENDLAALQAVYVGAGGAVA